MHLVLVTTGTQGDVRPFVALGLGLQERGYRVSIATHADHERLVALHGLAFRSIGSSFRQAVESEAGRAWLESGDKPSRYMKTFRQAFGSHLRPWLDGMHRAVLDADALIAHPFAFGAHHTAEQRRIPIVSVALVPMVVSGESEPVFAPKAPGWPWLRRLLGELPQRSLWSIIKEEHQRHRADLGLPPLRTANPFGHAVAQGLPCVHLFSSHLVPRPRDWPEHVHVAGFCHLADRAGWTPPQRLAQFLAAGPPPIYVGFGSMTGRDPEQLTRLTVEAVARAKQRAVVVSGWGGLGEAGALGDHVLVLDEVPHDWLFPRVSAVVHHGGAGTTEAGLRAGKPTLVAAFFGDQPYWGSRVARVGAGPEPILRRKLTVERLSDAISRTLAEPSYRTRAEQAGAAIKSEDGVANAAELIARYVGHASGAHFAVGGR